MSVSADSGRERGSRLALMAVLLLAVLPSLGTLGAPWIAEDASILARVEADGPWADWTRGQYGMRLLRFWRPVVSTSWALQASATGIAPLPLRLANLALHLGVVALAFACARRLRAGPLGAFVAGAWIGLFPEQGGTVTWLAGRTDLLGAFFLLASLHAALGPRRWGAAPLAFLACASKEFGFLAPLWIAVFAWARGDTRGELSRRALPAVVGAALAFLWRRLALGSFEGGYPVALPGALATVLGAARATLVSSWPSLLGLAVLALASAWGSEAGMRSARTRGLVAAGMAAGLALGLLVPLLADGFLEPENRRLLYVAEVALALGGGLAMARAGIGKPGGVAIAAVLATRLVLAWGDTHDWARAAREGEDEVQRARAALEGATPSEVPVPFAGFSLHREGAYCLGYGVAARFRSPFPATPRPVWPWRLAFVPDPVRERVPRVAPRADGSIWPADDRPLAPLLAVRREDPEAPLPGDGSLRLDARAFPSGEDRTPRLELSGGPPSAALEVLVVTELGYEPIPLPPLDGAGTARVTLRELLAGTNGVAAAGQLLQQAADLGATVGWLELRALGPQRELLAASEWIRVEWAPDLLDRALSGG